MARRGIRKKDFERLDDSTVGRVVSLLEQDSPITKKAACEMLNISYNTKRLGTILQDYKDKIEFSKLRLKQNRGKPFTNIDLRELVVDYLSGASVSQIASNLFRSIHVIKAKIKELHLPERDSKHTYHKPGLIPDEMLSDTYIEGELVWSARYNAVAEIMKELSPGIYRIYVFGAREQFAIQPNYELGKLDILKTLNLKDGEFRQNNELNISYRVD